MFAVDDVLISDAVLDAPFSCNLGACRGACCVQGESGAPVRPEERQELEHAFSVIRDQLRPEALDVIERDGVWTEEAAGEYATSCVDGAECVFVVYEKGVAKCAIQRAHYRGQLDFEKPISCHLFPLREESWTGTTVLNYEQIDICRPAVKHGGRSGTQLVTFLRAPLTRRFGSDWYERFRSACSERATELATATAR